MPPRSNPDAAPLNNNEEGTGTGMRRVTSESSMSVNSEAGGEQRTGSDYRVRKSRLIG